jgi:DNA (cytosine-5)-methyltransferase 1
MTLRVLDLFSGIGGFSLGLERTGGFKTVAFCEIEAYPRQVLAKHWPGVPIYDDVRTLTADTLSRDGIAVDVICGGFPCQDISFAGKRSGLEGARSGLWVDYARLIGEIRPRFVIVENTPGLLSLGMGDVLGDLVALGYDAVWDCVPASAIGAPHQRDRVWIVAHANGGGCRQDGLSTGHYHEANGEWSAGRRRNAGAAADTDRSRPPLREGKTPTRADGASEWQPSAGSDWWASEPDVERVVHGLPMRVDRIKALGNSVVPQIPEMIGRAILEAAE